MPRPKGSKNAPKPKADKAPKADKPVKPPKDDAKKFNSPVNEEDKALFLGTHLPNIASLKAKLATASSNLRLAYKTAKADGFTKNDFSVAFQIQEAEGEKAKKAAIARDLTIAKWLGCDLGAQLDLFAQDERVPAADRAFEEGIAASMKGETAKPPYDPSTEQHRRFMEGFHSDTERRLKAGITKPEPEPDKEKPKKSAKPADELGVSEEPTSGVPMTRAQFKALQEANGGSEFKRKAH